MLPQAAETTIYMTGNCRSGCTTSALRSANGTQAEHMAVAEDAKEIFREHFPSCAAAMDELFSGSSRYNRPIQG